MSAKIKQELADFFDNEFSNRVNDLEFDGRDLRGVGRENNDIWLDLDGVVVRVKVEVVP
jgi:hypothetical protein